MGFSLGAGCEMEHTAIDDSTLLAYVEVLADEKHAMTVGLLLWGRVLDLWSRH